MAIRNKTVSKKGDTATDDVGAKTTRRRGEALEDSLLDSAWEVLASTGFGGFTMDAVATHAGTSRPVLYRRWSTSWELALGAIRRRMLQNPIAIPDTGNIRDDLVLFLDDLVRRRSEILVLFSLGAVQVFGEAKKTVADFFERLQSGRTSSSMLLLERAVARGEIDPAKLTPRIAKLPFYLVRYEMFATLRPVPREVLEEIVDQIFLPLVRSSPKPRPRKP
jgi:AcrR family transcriptional regulator